MKRSCLKMLFSLFFALFFTLLSIVTGQMIVNIINSTKTRVFSLVINTIVFVVIVWISACYWRELYELLK